MLIKDNHVAIAGGVRAAVERARAHVGHMVKIELEVDTLAQLEEALQLRVDAVLLDNMGPDDAAPGGGDGGRARRSPKPPAASVPTPRRRSPPAGWTCCRSAG